MIDLIVCATQRCGSTMILEDMRNSEILGNPEELFIDWNPREGERSWKDELEHATAEATGPNGLSSVKLMATQLMDFDDCVATFVHAGGDRFCESTATVFRDSHWVLVRRADVVAQAISRVMAAQTGLYHATGNADDEHFAGSLLRGYSSRYNQCAEYRYEPILKEVTAISLENLAWKSFFETHGISPLVLDYETVAGDDSMTHLDSLCRHVGLNDRPGKRPRKMVKMANERSVEWQERFIRESARSRFRRGTSRGTLKKVIRRFVKRD